MSTPPTTTRPPAPTAALAASGSKPAALTPQEVIALHGDSAWVDKPGYCNGSMIRCRCGWTADCEGHDGTTRRALWPQHVTDELAAVGVMPAATALRGAAADLRRLGGDGPYLEGSGRSTDGVGNESGRIDAWYAAWLERSADSLPGPAADPVISPRVDHTVPPNALRDLRRFLGVPSRADA